ncbi:MAG: PorT family protein [Alistipes sp.]|nr:PorT family protein [Alistipes sp.]
MKKTLLLLLLLPALAQTANCQYFGVKGGANIAMHNNASAADATLYFHTGIYLRESLEPRRGLWHRFFIQPELTYSRQGASLPDDELWIKNDYVNLSLVFQYMPLRKLGLEFGPQVGYLAISDVTDKWAGKKNREGVGSMFRKTDYALCFGIFYRTWTFADFSVRYNLGLNDIVRHNPGKRVNNGVFQFSMLIDIW